MVIVKVTNVQTLSILLLLCTVFSVLSFLVEQQEVHL